MTAPHARSGECLRLARAIVSLSLLFVAACGDADANAGAAAVAVRDSAGVRIVENSSRGGSGAVWRLGSAPELDIGVVEGDSVYQLHWVSGATRLTDGRIAVANSGTSEVRLFAADGRFLTSIGRSGEGPGEFRQLAGLWPYRGDSLLVWDAGLRRVTVLDDQGEVVRQSVLAGAPGNPALLAPFDSGDLALVDERWELSGPTEQDQYVAVTHLASDGSLVDSIGRFLLTTTYRVGSGPSTFVGSPGFSPYTSIAGLGEGFMVGYGSEPELLSYAADGTLKARVRWPDEGDRSVAENDIARFKSENIDNITDENQRRDRRRYFETIPYESHFPVYDHVVATRGGGVWVRLFRRPGEAEASRWLVIDSAGVVSGEVATPRGFRILEIGDDYVLGVERDELDVEHVRSYRLLNGEAQRGT